MKTQVLLILLGMFLSSVAGSEMTQTGDTGCNGFDIEGLTLARPIVKVIPPDDENGVESCVIAIFALKEKRGSEGQAAAPYKVKIVASSDDVDKVTKDWVKRGIKKWTFMTRTQAPSKDRKYYYVFTF